MLCSISGHVTETPVVSIKSGLVFEKRLIEHEIAEHGVCPITKEPLTQDDLIDVKNLKTNKPRPLKATSIPGLLDIFHDEWDALMIECHSLRQSLSTTRQELSHALYQHDAAVRVIARLMKERDTAREALTKIQSQHGLVAEDVEMDEQPAKRAHLGITKEISDLIVKASKESAKQRKKFSVPEDCLSPDDLKGFKLLTSQPLHAIKQGGILSLAYHPQISEVIASAGEDCTIQIFDQSRKLILASIEEHFKRVNGVEWINEALLVSCSSDRSVRVWMREDEGWKFKCGIHSKDHNEPVMAVTVSPTGRFVLSASKDTMLGFLDLEQGRFVEKITSPVVESPYTCAKFHPDGLIVGTGTQSGDIHLWDVARSTIVKSFSEEGGSIKAIGFHENGIHWATATSDKVRIWDLRKMASFRDLQPYDEAVVSSSSFDPVGRYLAVGGSDLRVYDSSDDYSEVTKFSDFPRKVRCIAMKECLAAGSVDHNLRIFGQD